MLDVVVIGGGINGTAVARDCTLRGLRVALVEKNDFAFGASGNNSGMIHGGPRYLLTHPNVTEDSCRDSGYIQQIASHLVFRIPFLMPVRKTGRRSAVQLAALDAFFEFYDRYQPLKGGKKHSLLSGEELAQVYPGLCGEFAGAVSFDEWGIDGNRLCVLHAKDAYERGAQIYPHHEVVGLVREGSRRVVGVVCKDTSSGERRELRARVVVNATGAWADWFRRANDDEHGQPPGEKPAGVLGQTPLVRPGKGIHVHYDRRFSNYGLVTEAIDGRQIFLMPWQNISWIATTDDDYYGDLDRVRATQDEVRYLVQGIEQIFPSVRQGRVIGTSAGLRPTLWAYGKPEDALSREHEVVHHGARDGLHGLYSMVGGKLASYRIFAEQMTDEIVKVLGVRAACSTHRTPLPGSEHVDSSAEAGSMRAAGGAFAPNLFSHVYEEGAMLGLSAVALERLVYRHGARAREVLGRVRKRPPEARFVCDAEPVTEAEVRYACQHEWVRTLDDLARRTRIAVGRCGGVDCVQRAALIAAEELGWSERDARLHAESYLGDLHDRRSVA
jgi:glycerol-3-phosphate dehydrogenase